MISDTIEFEAQKEQDQRSPVIFLEADKVSSAVLKRLIEEVRNDRENNVTAYDRLHNRHNR